MVSAKIRLSLKSSCQATPKRTIYNWNEFSRDKEMQQRFSSEVRNKYSALANDTQSATEQYDHFVEANRETTKDIVPPVSRKKSDIINKDPSTG